MKDPFVYKDTNILINKLDLRNQELLDQFESTMFQLAFMKILEDGFVVTIVNDVLKLHKLLFEEVYDWAGTVRTINIEKQEPVLNGLSVNYGDKASILKDLNRLNKTFEDLNVKDNFVENLVRLISKVWQMHPFREGNTRTITAFIQINFTLMVFINTIFQLKNLNMLKRVKQQFN
jgi:cell filamentation protein